MGAIAVITTVGTEQEANDIAVELLSRRQAACVNIVSGVRSIYRWQGRICKDSEYLLLVKSMDVESEGIAATIREFHTYDLPEILVFRIHEGDDNFLAWITECVDKTIDDDDDDQDDLESGDLPA